MDDKFFYTRIENAKTQCEIAQLAYDLLQESLDCDIESEFEAEIICLPQRIQKLVDKGLDVNTLIGSESCIFDLQYGYTDYHLQAAKIIFENCGIPTVVDEDGDTFFSYIRSKIDYNYYNCEFLVKLYLLCCAYTDEETYLKMEENLYEEMFEDSEYISSFDGKIPFNPTPKIFKNIEKYDYCIEMTEQKDGCHGCWKLIIYDKKSRIKVATFC